MRNRRLSNKEDKLLQQTKFLLTPEELEVNEMENNESSQKAKKEFDKIQKDEHERYLAELRMKHILDTESIREGGFEEGIEKGKEEKRNCKKNVKAKYCYRNHYDQYRIYKRGNREVKKRIVEK